MAIIHRTISITGPGDRLVSSHPVNIYFRLNSNLNRGYTNGSSLLGKE